MRSAWLGACSIQGVPNLALSPQAARGQAARLAAAGVFAITAPLYLLTMNRTIGFIDRGELAAVACTLGIAHPTGYPTLTLLGFLVTHLAPLRPVLGLNTFAALLVAAGAAVLTLLFDHVLEKTCAERVAPAPRAAYAALAGLFIALTETWWQQANGFEVYALHALLLPLVLLLYLRFVDSAVEHRARTASTGAGAVRPGARPHLAGYAFAFTLGLSFTNHMSTVLLAPALLAHYFARLGRGRRALTTALRLVPAFVIGLLPYAWIPFRASMHPRFDWGGPDDLSRLLAHVTGRTYQALMFDFGEVSRTQLAYFTARLPGELAFVGLPLIVLGAWRLLRVDRRLALMMVLLLATSVVYGVGYRIRDIDQYFLTAFAALGMCVAAGLAALHERARAPIVVAAGVALVLSNVGLHHRACDESRNMLVEDFVHNVLEPLPRNAVLITNQWDQWLSGSYYYQTVEKLRPDVLVVSEELTTWRWYLDELERRDPDFMRRIAPEVDRYRRATAPLGRREPVDAALIQKAHSEMIAAMCDPRVAGRAVFVTGEIKAPAGRGVWRVPTGLVVRLTTDSSYVGEDFPAFRWRPWPNRPDFYVSTTSLLYGLGLEARMEYEARHGHSDRAEAYRRYALEFDPGFRLRDLPPLPHEGRYVTVHTIRFFEDLERRAASPVAAR